MNKFLTIFAIAATMMFGAAHASGKKATAVTQFQAVGSVVTTANMAAAISNASNKSFQLVGPVKGGFQVVITATDASGSTVSVPAVVSTDGGVVTVTFADGSSATFNMADFS